MKHFFLDTNVVLDFLAQREPFAAPATNLFHQAEKGNAVLHVSSLSFSHALYLLRKSVGSASARSLLVDLSGIVAIATVDAAHVNEALRSNFADFEDAIQYFAARSIPAVSHIVPRDPKGFAGGELPVVTPTKALRLLS